MLDSLLTRPGSRSDALLHALARRLHAAGFQPNTLTAAAVVTGLVGGGLFALDRGWLALTALAVSGALDATDGRVARLGPGPTPWGGVLDLVSDRVVEAAVLLGLALPRPHLHAPALVLAATWYVNLCVFLAVGAASERASAKLIDYPPGLVERTEALVFAGVVVAAPAFAPAAVWAYAALEVATAAQRLRYGRRALQRDPAADPPDDLPLRS
jgi:phosphatidylglycerophosphate synthase